MTGPQHDEFDFDTPFGRFITGLMNLFYGSADVSPDAVLANVQAVIAEALPIAPPLERRDPRAAALAFVGEAWEAADDLLGCNAALNALRLDPDCVDAYVYLGQAAGSEVEVGLPLFTLGVMTGYKTLGQQLFDEEAGRFWSIAETRPFMRALEGVAHMNWLAGAPEAAALHFRELLRLNPNDDQGVRYPLGALLLEQHAGADFELVAAAYEDDTAAPLEYLRALSAFQAGGDSPAAGERLAAARAANPHLGRYLAGLAQPGAQTEWSFEPGSEGEAAEFAPMMDRAWEGTAGAIAWLRRAFGAPPPKARREGPRAID